MECVRALLRSGANMSVTSQDGWSPLQVAALRGHTDCLEELLAAGGAKDTKTEARHVPPHRPAPPRPAPSAVTSPKPKSKTTLHINVSIDININIPLIFLISVSPRSVKSQSGELTLLHLAAGEGHAACVALLVARGVARDAREKAFGATPLHLAAGQGHACCVRALLEAGADLTARDDVRFFPGPPSNNAGAWQC